MSGRDLLRFVLVGEAQSGKTTLAARLPGAAPGQGASDETGYRHFATPRRRFIVADAPGGEGHAAAMAAGASGAELAVLVLDAAQGLSLQARRHAFVCALLGIPRLVVAVNKMDLADWSQQRFAELSAGLEQFAARLAFQSMTFIPLSALEDQNVAHRGAALAWYGGRTLLEHLETEYIGADRNLVDLRFVVQGAARAEGALWHLGRLASGVVRPGDEVVVLPSHRRSRVRSLALGGRALEYAFAPQSVALALEDEVELARGALLSHPRNAPRSVRALEAMLLWMGEPPLRAGGVYLLKLGAGWVRASCAEVSYRMDPATLHRDREHALAAGDIGRAGLTLFQERFVDPYSRCRGTGAFIVVDPATQATLGAGTVVDRESEHERLPSRAAAERIVLPHAGKVSVEHRAQLLGQRPATVWLTGLSGAGKSTLATELEKRLIEAGRACFMLDGDNVRVGINRDLGFAPEDRRENIRRIAEVARLMNEAGLIVVTAFISPYREDREMARRIIGPERFVEVHLDASLEVCEERDPKGLYRRARAGEIPEFTGVSAPYEAPQAPAVVLHTGALGVEPCLEQLLGALLPRTVPTSAATA